MFDSAVTVAPEVSALEVLCLDPEDLAPDDYAAYVNAAYTLMDQARARLLAVLGTVDATIHYRLEGQASTGSWLRHLVSVTDLDAGRLVTLARRLHRAPIIAAALAAGDVSVSRAEALVRPMGNPRVRAEFARQQAVLLEATAGLDADDVVAFTKEWEHRFDFDGPRPGDEAHDSTCTLGQNPNGRWNLKADLTPEHGSTLAAELQAIIDQLRNDGAIEGDDLPKGPRLRGLALAEMAVRASASENRNPAAPTALVIVPDEALHADDDAASNEPAIRPAKLDGTPLTTGQLRRILCDCIVHKITVDSDGAVLRMGRSHRTATKEQHLYLAARDGGCVFPGCHQPPSRCRAHHIAWWIRDTGPTDIENMCLVCDRHHDLIHRGIWQPKLVDHGKDGVLWTHLATGRTEHRPRHQHWLLNHPPPT